MKNIDDVFDILEQARKELKEAKKRAKAELDAARKKARDDLKAVQDKTSKAINEAVKHAKELKKRMEKRAEEGLVEFKPVANRAFHRAVLTSVLASSSLGNIADANTGPECESLNENTTGTTVPEAFTMLDVKPLDASEIDLIVEQVELTHPKTNKTYYEFINRAAGKVNEFKDATAASLWDASYWREVGDLDNPVGGGSQFLGSFQANTFNAQNVLIYAAINEEEFGNIAERFFNSGEHYNLALHKFKQDYKVRGTLAFHTKQKAREALARQLKEGFKGIFAKEGKENPVQFLKLQRAYGSNIMAHFDENGLDKVNKVLAEQNIKPEDISAGVWSMVVSKMVVNNYSGIPELFKGKTAKEINTVKFIESFANKFPKVFHEYSGPKAVKFAKEHLHESHSVTTAGELSAILGKPEVLNRYMKYLSFAQNKNITFSQAQAFKEAYDKIENSPAMVQKREQLEAFLKGNIKPVSLIEIVSKSEQSAKEVISPLAKQAMMNARKAKKAKG